MILWVIFAVLISASVLALLSPLIVTHREQGQREAFDATVYKDQLQEVDSDLARGLVGEEDADAARVEISRRLLAVADKADLAVRGHFLQAAVASVVSCSLVLLLSLGLYLSYGSPSVPDQPLSARLSVPPELQRIDELVVRVEARLRANPEDGMGWDVIAPVYLKLQRYEDAEDAFARSIKLLGETKERLFGQGEAVRLANDGIVTTDARAAFHKAIKLDPGYVPVLYRLAVAKEQDGEFAEAVKAWQDIVKRLPDGEAWRQDATQRLKAAEARRDGKEVPAPLAEPSRGPSQKQVAAARQITAEQRQTMINDMVGRLAKRLKEDGQDLEGWKRLVRAYVVLGRKADAEAALESAKQNFSKDKRALSSLSALADQMGLGRNEDS